MFEKNQVIYSEGIGVCKVADTPMLSAGKKEGVRYYLLRSLQDQKRTSYIPVAHHNVTLRELISPEQAKEMDRTYARKDEEEDKLPAHRRFEVEYVLSHLEQSEAEKKGSRTKRRS